MGKYPGDPATEKQVGAIASLMWHRATKQQAHDLIQALERLPAKHRDPPKEDLRKRLQQGF